MRMKSRRPISQYLPVRNKRLKVEQMKCSPQKKRTIWKMKTKRRKILAMVWHSQPLLKRIRSTIVRPTMLMSASNTPKAQWLQRIQEVKTCHDR